jgi:hypothetical protein
MTKNEQNPNLNSFIHVVIQWKAVKVITLLGCFAVTEMLGQLIGPIFKDQAVHGGTNKLTSW